MNNENDKVKEALKGETSGLEKALGKKAVTKTPDTPKLEKTVTEKVPKKIAEEVKAPLIEEEEEEAAETKNSPASDLEPDPNLEVSNSEEYDLEAVMEFLSGKGMQLVEWDKENNSNKPHSGTVIGTEVTLKKDFKGDTVDHVINATANIIRKLRKEGVLQINSVIIGDEVHSKLVYN
jgi:hypothetical protein